MVSDGRYPSLRVCKSLQAVLKRGHECFPSLVASGSIAVKAHKLEVVKFPKLRPCETNISVIAGGYYAPLLGK